MLPWSSRQLSWRSSWPFLSLTLSPLCAHLRESLPLDCWSKSQNKIKIYKLLYFKGFQYFYSTVHSFYFSTFFWGGEGVIFVVNRPLWKFLCVLFRIFDFLIFLLSFAIICNKILMHVSMMSFVEISPCRIRKLMTMSLTLAVFLRWTGHGRRGSWPSR